MYLGKSPKLKIIESDVGITIKQFDTEELLNILQGDD